MPTHTLLLEEMAASVVAEGDRSVQGRYRSVAIGEVEEVRPTEIVVVVAAPAEACRWASSASSSRQQRGCLGRSLIAWCCRL